MGVIPALLPCGGVQLGLGDQVLGPCPDKMTRITRLPLRACCAGRVVAGWTTGYGCGGFVGDRVERGDGGHFVPGPAPLASTAHLASVQDC